MKQRLKLFGIYSIFWITYFVIARILFMFYEYSISFDLSIKEWFLVFIHGFRMDLSSTGYIVAIVGFLLVFTSFSRGKLINIILRIYTVIVLIISSIIVISDLELYLNWGFRMDATPLLYLDNPKEAMASTETWLTIVLLLVTAGYVLLGLFVYNRKIKDQVLKIKRSNIYTSLVLLILTASMILPIRGGIGIAPMNSGMVYFSKNKFANHAAINVVWNVMHSVVYRKKQAKTYNFMPTDIAKEIVKDLNKQNGKSHKILTKENPNVVILVLESFSSKVLTNLGGKWNAAPNLNSLLNEGIVFSNFYANGSRSDKGLISILSGYPGQPTTSIMKIPSKTESLPSLFNSFNKIGYETSYYYGGDIDFANMRSYISNSGAKNVICLDDFDAKLNESKWGVHDEYLFEYLFEDIINHKDPYFKILFTLSSHDPFEVPMEPVFKGVDRATQYLNSIYYADSCLGDFINKVKKTDVWDNTLFILVADHGSNKPGKSQNHDFEKFQIPMLWLGGVLNDSIKIVNKTGSQIDIPATLLNQLGISISEYTYSKDMFSETSSEFAFYVFNDGFAYITDSTKVIYDNIGKDVLKKEGEIDRDLIEGKAFLQVLMDDFISR
ncbi:MAG: sulfatase-like hydrolase/transferase [Bacteroidales bacterium]|jgi:phosphoglycerol transferase MdoB-like AlkP superfamily enzyme|nr:sulfatase-like hydrolase/transferase [Bacteroidales bacterium]